LSPLPTLDPVLAFLRDDLREVERELIEGTASVAPLIPQLARYTLGGGGKRIRPLLVLLSARLLGYGGRRAIRVAACVEWLHSASLLHDDVVDGARLRRGQPSANVRFGAREAVLVGDFLYAQLCQVLVEDGNREILASFSHTIGQMAEGEVLQLSRSFDPSIDEATYVDVIGRKTSSLLATAAEAGALLAGAKPDEQCALREYGWQLGMAFQLVDDALDYGGTREELGKAPLSDLAEGKVTLPLLLALQRCGAVEREELGEALRRLARAAVDGLPPEVPLLERVARAVARHGGVERTRQRAVAHASEAALRLEGFEHCEARRALRLLAEFVVSRRC
jgi:octaprenyl-diphosphate synthase